MKLSIDPYSIELPPEAVATVSLGQSNTTHWQIALGRFQFLIHLESQQGPKELADFILSCTKQRVEPRAVHVNGISGVTYGAYEVPRSWIDWWFKKNDVMICINLQGYADATANERALHSSIIESLRYLPNGHS
jgi:hypothetical protein